MSNSYKLADVDAAEARIRKECPGALVIRDNYGWSLIVARGTQHPGEVFTVFDTRPHAKGVATIIGDLDAIIGQLKAGDR